MEKIFLVQQPPISERFRVLVDTCTDSGTYGGTTDKDMVLYNLELLGVKAMVEERAVASAQGLTFLLPAGRYIMIAKIKNDLSRMSMDFFDFRTEKEFKEVNATVLNNEFSEHVVNQFDYIRSQLLASYKEPEDDVIEFSVIDKLF